MVFSKSNCFYPNEIHQLLSQSCGRCRLPALRVCQHRNVFHCATRAFNSFRTHGVYSETLFSMNSLKESGMVVLLMSCEVNPKCTNSFPLCKPERIHPLFDEIFYGLNIVVGNLLMSLLVGHRLRWSRVKRSEFFKVGDPAHSLIQPASTKVKWSILLLPGTR